MIRKLVGKVALLTCLLTVPAVGQTRAGGEVANPVVLVIIIGTMSLAPFLAIMLTSFVKISIVLSLVKSALGSQVPAGQVTNGLAIVLTIFIMAPVAERMYEEAHLPKGSADVFATRNLVDIYEAAGRAKEPLREFLLKHAAARDRALFVSLGQRLDRSARPPAPLSQPVPPPAPGEPAPPAQDAAPPPRAGGSGLPPDREFRVVLPAFVTSELKNSFQVGFLVLLPFLVIDIVIANVLVALGLQMLQPAVVSLPMKILLFVVADGWYLIVKGLVLSYA
jgi:type III secretion protein R